MDDELRAAAFAWVREQSAVHGGVLPRSVLAEGVQFQGERITFVGPAGIWKPRRFELPLSITSVWNGPYDDGFTPEGLLSYRYRATAPDHRDNVGLREAMRTRTPLVYFHAVMEGRYVAVLPVFILSDNTAAQSFTVAIDPAYALEGGTSLLETAAAAQGPESILGIQRYVAAYTKRRLHQASFRERVVEAYSGTCALCRLRHRELLDGAHIIPDASPGGEPVVSNGLCLCKIHHAAYDQNIIAVSPDYTVQVRTDVLEEIDGPMLRHGLQGLHNGRILVPRKISDRPDRDRLAWRYEQFRKAV